MKELIEKRTQNGKVFDRGDGFHEHHYKTHTIHYKDTEGRFQDISMDIDNGGVHKCDYDVDLYTDRVGYHGTDPNGKKIELELTGVTYKAPIIKANVATYKNIENGVDFEIDFQPGQIKVNRILKKC